MATTQRSVRVDDETWEKFGELCEQDGQDRSSDLVTYMKYRIAGGVGYVARTEEGSKDT
jgi:hypothetical protein